MNSENRDNLFLALRAGFPADLDSVAIETVGERNDHYSWCDLERGSAMLANLITAANLPPASRIAVQTEKSVEALMLYLAVLRTGHVYLPLNPAYRRDEIAYFIGNAEPALAVCAPGNFSWFSRIAFAAGVEHVYTLDASRGGSLLQRAAVHDDHHLPVACGGDDLAAILYTSGTTGRSKGAMLTHRNLLSNARTLQTLWGWRSAAEGGDVLIHALPIFHVHGLFVATHGALLAGAKMLWFDRFDATAVVERLPEATVFMGVPTLYTRLLAEPGLNLDACRNMRIFISGSAPMQVETFDHFRERTGHTVLERYGMSETAILTSNPWRLEAGSPGRVRGKVGRPLPAVDLRVRDDAGADCPVDAIGHVEVRGPNVFAGYWRMPEKTAAEFTADGWFKTGDIGHIDRNGYLTLVGRSKDLIISGGFNIYPAEVEAALNEEPGIAESAVVGVPHPDFGEAVIAVVVADDPAFDPLAAIAALKTRIARFKVPKQVFVVPELPRNAMGKVQKQLLRERYQASFATV